MSTKQTGFLRVALVGFRGGGSEQPVGWGIWCDEDVSGHLPCHEEPLLSGAHHKAGATGLIDGGAGGNANEPFSACTLPGTVPLPSADDLR